MSKPSVLIVGADAESELAIRRAIESVAVVAGRVAPGVAALEQHRALAPQVVLVLVGGAAVEAALRQVTLLSQAGAQVVVAGAAMDPELILGAMRAGAREFVLVSDAPELRRVVLAQARPAEAAAGLGEIITIFPTRGGVGATTIATNLGGALKRRGSEVCLVDLDLHLGDVLSFLDLPSTNSITEVIANLARLDTQLLETSLVRHGSGLRVLAQGGKVEDAESVRTADIVALLELLRKHHQHLVVDGINGFDERSLAVLDASQHLVMVLTQDVPAVRSAKRCLELFRRLGYDDRKIKLVLNRYQRQSKISSEVVSEALGLPVNHIVSNDFPSAIEAINRGLMLQDLAPRSTLTRDIEAMAPLFMTDDSAGPERRGFFRGLWSRKGHDGSSRAA
jgi:pilus assembly protein CpaE